MAANRVPSSADSLWSWLPLIISEVIHRWVRTPASAITQIEMAGVTANGKDHLASTDHALKSICWN